MSGSRDSLIISLIPGPKNRWTNIAWYKLLLPLEFLELFAGLFCFD